jgi:autotransporter-associated beta strand protein
MKNTKFSCTASGCGKRSWLSEFREFSRVRFQSLLFLGVAGAALMASANHANADGLTFNWTGAGNGTSFGRAANFSFGYDADGNPAYDGDGNPVKGPPNGLDNMTVTSGTPTVSSGTRHILSLDVSGGQFIVRNSTHYGPSAFFVDGMLNLSDSGALTIGADDRGASVLSVDTMVMTGGIITGVDAPGILSITNSLSQSGGDVSQVTINTPSYALLGGTLSAPVNFTNLFSLSDTGTVESAAQLTGSGSASAMTQSGGVMNGVVTGVASYTQSGGSLGGSVTTKTYDLNDATATSSGGTITASDTFKLEPDSGTAIVDARLSGTGALVKSGASTVVLTGSNDFTGTVSINAGTLEVQNGAALADTAAVTIANTVGAELLVTNSELIGSLAGGPASAVTIADGQTLTTGDATNTVFMGTMDGETGSLAKVGSGTFTLGGDVMIGGLLVNNGELAIGTGTSTNTASFESATVASGATLYVASGATLTIRIPNNLINNGHLINDGTIVDDLDNNSVYDNHADNIADVASNTSIINNDTPDGFWTGDVLTNAGVINNYNVWKGNVVSNQFPINFTYTGVINNYDVWTGDILSNNFLINNNAGGTWTGDVVDNDYNIANAGTWIGDVKKNSGGTISNDGATAVWTGDVLTNDSQIVNTNGATWNGKVDSNNNAIFNLAGSAWKGDVVANGGGSNGVAQIDNYGTWTGAVDSNAGWIFNLAGSWNGDVLTNSDVIINNKNDVGTNPTGANHAVWTGDIVSNDGPITNDHGGTWNGKIFGNNDSIFNQTDAIWKGDVAANGGGSNPHAKIDNHGTWTGDVLSNAGIINNSGIWNGDFTSAGTVNAENRINGAFDNSGVLQLTGSLSGITTLTNSGTLDMRNGSAAQTLTAASASFGANSFYNIDVDAAGKSDKMVVTGAAVLAGTVQVTAMSTAGPYGDTTGYTILKAGSISGTFAHVTTDLAFLAPHLSYGDEDVSLTLKRNDHGFAYAGVTRNQKAAAGAAESLGAGNEVYDAVLWLTNDQAKQAFDDLSGEAYNSVESAFVQNASVIADVVTRRIDQAFDAPRERGSATGSCAEDPARTRTPSAMPIFGVSSMACTAPWRTTAVRPGSTCRRVDSPAASTALSVVGDRV